ncbi:MAG: hypothetical protein P4M11_15805 [Candidatus Pacebacteria bacterium]|nr:hypothetical protein [Candidatus Paceibacterota bacterium]
METDHLLSSHRDMLSQPQEEVKGTFPPAAAAAEPNENQDSGELEVAEIEVDAKTDYNHRLSSRTSHMYAVTAKRSNDLLRSSSARVDKDVEDNQDFLDTYAQAAEELRAAGKLRYLKYGDKIKLQVSDGAEPACLYSDGFATRRVYLQKGGSSVKVNEVFRVMPRSNYEYLAKIRLELKQMIKSSSGGEPAEEETEEHAKAKERAYKKWLLEEIDANTKRHEDMLGKPVQYRDSVQLIHEETQQYVAVSKNVELSQKDITEESAAVELKMLVKAGVHKDIMRAYSLKLAPHTSGATHFLFVPCHRYQEAGYILEDDTFYLDFTDAKLLNKNFFFYSAKANTDTRSLCAYNAYMYEQIRTTLRYTSVDETPYAQHVFSQLNRKAVWITHIEAPLFLSLEKIEKSTEQEENELGDLILAVGEALSHNFSLGFKHYDETEPLSPKGMWIVTVCPEDRRKIILKHLLYDVWLKPMVAEKVARGEIKGNDGAVIKLSLCGGKGEHIAIGGAALAAANKHASTGKRLVVNTEDYASSFRVVRASEHDQLRNYTLAQLTMFVRSYDDQALRKVYDFTEEAAFKMLSRVLKSMKRLCLNTMPSVYDPSIPFKVPDESVQRVRYTGMSVR